MMRESELRRKQMEQRGEPVPSAKFLWWEPEHFLAVAKAALELGDELSHVQVVLGVDHKGRPDAHFRVVAKGEGETEDRQVYNYSHPCCPWECPPGFPPCIDT